MPNTGKNIALEPSRAINRPITKPVNEWGFGEFGAGSGVSNLLLETGDDLLLETGHPDSLLLE